ncbi:hypothetical protein NL676_019723 [Syzygium grande]|nr:hypothetical protein NL676_019723 [Syzygium grande]
MAPEIRPPRNLQENGGRSLDQTTGCPSNSLAVKPHAESTDPEIKKTRFYRIRHGTTATTALPRRTELWEVNSDHLLRFSASLVNVFVLKLQLSLSLSLPLVFDRVRFLARVHLAIRGCPVRDSHGVLTAWMWPLMGHKWEERSYYEFSAYIQFLLGINILIDNGPANLLPLDHKL